MCMFMCVYHFLLLEQVNCVHNKIITHEIHMLLGTEIQYRYRPPAGCKQRSLCNSLTILSRNRFGNHRCKQTLISGKSLVFK